MKKELDYFCIDGSIGWNQDWFKDWWMHIGGCAAVTACDLCVYLADKKGLERLYPYNAHCPTKREYLAFSKIMKPYLRPRWQGIDTLQIYLAGFSDYCRDVKVHSLKAEGLPGSAPFSEAKSVVKSQIDAGIPIPFLLLYHKSRLLKDFQWHWFNLAGYKDLAGEFYVKAITYGSEYWLNLEQLWDTGHEKRGGMIRLFNV